MKRHIRIEGHEAEIVEEVKTITFKRADGTVVTEQTAGTTPITQKLIETLVGGDSKVKLVTAVHHRDIKYEVVDKESKKTVPFKGSVDDESVFKLLRAHVVSRIDVRHKNVHGEMALASNHA